MSNHSRRGQTETNGRTDSAARRTKGSSPRVRGRLQAGHTTRRATPVVATGGPMTKRPPRPAGIDTSWARSADST
jgi:hypothetical protein